MCAQGKSNLKGALDKLDKGSGLAKIERLEKHMRTTLAKDPGFAKLSSKAQADRVRQACADWKATAAPAGGKGR